MTFLVNNPMTCKELKPEIYNSVVLQDSMHDITIDYCCGTTSAQNTRTPIYMFSYWVVWSCESIGYIVVFLDTFIRGSLTGTMFQE